MDLRIELQKNKNILSIELVDLSEAVVDIIDKKLQQKMFERIKLVYVYKFLYKVNSNKYVGYISLPKDGENLPCLIHLRGGSRNFGMLQPISILEKLVKFSTEGYVVIATQYPGVEGGDGIDTYGGSDDVQSIIKLKDILKSISVVNINKIGVKGHSRGGLMVYMLLRNVSWIKCAVIGGAPVDQISLATERKEWRDYQISMWGRSKKETLDRSPIFWIKDISKKVPLLIVHGSADWRISPTQSLRMSTIMYKLLIPHRLILFEGSDHNITECKDEYFNQTLNWFNRFLKNNEPLPNMKLHGK